MRISIRSFAALAALIFVASCVTKTEAVKPARATRTMVNIGGTLTYRGGATLPEGASITVEATDASRPGTAAISQTRWTTAGEQVPLNFTLTVDQVWFSRGKRLAIRATIQVNGATTYRTVNPFVLDGGIPPVPIELVLTGVAG